MVAFFLVAGGFIAGLVVGDVLDRYDILYFCPRCRLIKRDEIGLEVKFTADGKRVKVSRAEVERRLREEVAVEEVA